VTSSGKLFQTSAPAIYAVHRINLFIGNQEERKAELDENKSRKAAVTNRQQHWIQDSSQHSKVSKQVNL